MFRGKADSQRMLMLQSTVFTDPTYCLVFEGRNARPERGTDSNNNSCVLSRPYICQRPYIHPVI